MGATSSKGKNAKSQSKSTTTGSDVHQTLARPTVTGSSKAVDGTTRSRRASIQPRTSTIMEESPEIGTSTKTKASSSSRSIFMCCVVSAA